MIKNGLEERRMNVWKVGEEKELEDLQSPTGETRSALASE